MRTDDMRGRRVTPFEAPFKTSFRRPAALGAVMATLAVTACSGLLDVENPNSLIQDDLATPASAGALANGALSTVARAAGQAVMLHSAASDELVFTGSRDAWIQLQEGDLQDPANEFSDAAWPLVTEGRWMAEEAVRLLTVFDSEGNLGDRNLLARAKMSSASTWRYARPAAARSPACPTRPSSIPAVSTGARSSPSASSATWPA